MAKRLYVADIVGDGADENPFRPVLDDTPGIVQASYMIKTGADGHPVYPYALCMVDAGAATHSTIGALSGVDPLPVRQLATVWTDLSAAQRTAIRNRLQARGFTLTDLADITTLRDLVRLIGRRLSEQFDERHFGAGGAE